MLSYICYIPKCYCNGNYCFLLSEIRCFTNDDSVQHEAIFGIVGVLHIDSNAEKLMRRCLNHRLSSFTMLYPDSNFKRKNPYMFCADMYKSRFGNVYKRKQTRSFNEYLSPCAHLAPTRSNADLSSMSLREILQNRISAEISYWRYTITYYLPASNNIMII